VGCVYLGGTMNILVLGGGGREHALVWKLRQSPQAERIWCAPGNGGIAQHAECVPARLDDVAALAALAEQLRADLTVAGPEQPLVLGVADEFERRGLRFVGPAQQAAQLEGSKVFAKEFMQRHNIPTAPVYGVYDSPGDAYTALCAVDWPVVIKADGLCAGKGVLVASTPDEATAFLARLMEEREFGAAGDRVLMEEALTGQELSYIVLTDGEHIVPLLAARDYKRAFDGDRGPNTGGMGAYTDDGLVSPRLEEQICKTIVEPTIAAMAAEGRPYKGFLYFGLMLTEDGPKVLEFNCRCGDPETQAIVVRMDFDLAEALVAVAEGRLGQFAASWKPGASVCVVMASGGYPGTYETGKKIEGLTAETSPGGDVVVFHAGTRREGNNYYTSGGRVLGVTAAGATLEQAAARCYDTISKIHFEGAHYRRDIASRASGSASAGD
jgi:phosphoribosylamine--glycine ligase